MLLPPAKWYPIFAPRTTQAAFYSGYLGNPELFAETVVPNPFGPGQVCAHHPLPSAWVEWLHASC